MSQSIEVLLQKWNEVKTSTPDLFRDFEHYCEVMTKVTPIKSVKIGSSVIRSLETTTESLERPIKSITTTPSVTTEVTLSDTTEVSLSDTTEVSLSDTTEVTQSDTTEVTQSDTTEVTQSDTTEVTQSDTTEISAQKYRLIFDLLTGSHDIKKLAEKCSVVTKALIDVSNLAPLWILALGLHDDNVNDICLNFFCENTKDIKSNDTVVKSLSVDVIKHITSSEDTSIKEIDLFNFVHHWINLTKPLPDVVDSIINNIRLPLLQSKELVSIVKPSKLVDNEVYVEALEFSVDPSNDKTEKRFTARLPKLPQLTEFFFYYNDKPCPGFRMVVNKDITPDFVARMKKYVEKNGGIAALDDFDTRKHDREIRTDNHYLKINKKQLFINTTDTSYTKNSICPVYADNYKVSTVENVDVGRFSGSGRGIAIYVKEGVKF